MKTNRKQDRIDKNARLAADSFKDHEIKREHRKGVFRHYRCGNKDGSSNYLFFVTTTPCFMFITGDIGDFIWRREYDMIDWARSAINSPGYFAEKVVAGEVWEYDPDMARDSVKELIDECDGDDVKVKSAAQEILDTTDFDSQHEFVMDAYNACLFDDFPTCKNYTHGFLWCRQALLWFFRNLKEEDV